MLSYLEVIQIFVLIFTLLFISTIYFLTKISINYNIQLTNKFNIFLDKPIHRSSHKIITPRSAGISLFGMIMPFLFIFDIYLACFSTFMFLIGLRDDYKPLNNKLKLVLIFLSVFLLIYLKFNFETHNMFEYLFVSFIVVSIIIGFNFIDGLNGVAGFLSYLTLFTVFILHVFLMEFNYLYIGVILISLIAFLEFNLKGKIFLGDSGSMFLGSIIAYLLFDLFDNNLIKSLDIIFLSGVFFVDLIGIILFRLCVLKVSPFTADRNHIHHVIFYSNKRSLTLTLTYLIFIHISIISITFIG